MMREHFFCESLRGFADICWCVAFPGATSENLASTLAFTIIVNTPQASDIFICDDTTAFATVEWYLQRSDQVEDCRRQNILTDIRGHLAQKIRSKSLIVVSDKFCSGSV